MSYRNKPYSSELDLTRANNQEITIDCESYSNNGAIRVNNGSSNMTSASHSRHQSGNSGMANSSSAHTLFESTADNSSYRVLRSYREYAAQFINSDDSMDSNSDITGAADASSNTSINESGYKKNTYDIYGDQIESKSIDYDIKKSNTIKSTTTSSSRTAYKNPTLSSVVNQTLVNSSFDKSTYDQQYDEIKKIKEENHKKIDPQLKLQKMILKVPETYDIPTRNKKIISQRLLNLTLVLVVIIATTLIALYIYLKINHGYSFPHIKDISDENRTKLIFIGLFMYLAVILGSVGSALNWKSILVTYCIFCSLNALALGYLVYGIYENAYKYSNLPFAWWDFYSATTRKTIQDNFSCCGFREPLDGGEISNFCPKNAVVWNIPYETIYDNFLLRKKDACSKGFNVTVVEKNKEQVVLPTPVIEQVPTPTADVNTPTDNNDEVNSNSSPSPTTVETTNTEATATPVESTNSDVSSKTEESTSTTGNDETETTGNNETEASDKTKRTFEIEDENMVIWKSPVQVNNIYNILAANEVEEEDDSRDDKLIASIRVLNKRTYVKENKDEYQLRVNDTNPEINRDNIINSNYTKLTPEESREFSKANKLEGCEAKIKPYIHKNLVPIFYTLLVFFCLYIITIPTALIFLFKLRTIPSINEFE
jgi:hypothetical protein